ncbi:hypothetical protein A1O3_08942 [Capronia epimyces CBS 606.96]|uniref:Uncharacterized protein n=1 Tax=Capronia epimyces CBS 606.96 TaxID=1182542 RepID=W9XQ49_9EURO|nr:uncharacterized protein A1O3_08942 [Capronia epimyces CBS 606.96]EXJ79440.1 hypothetical protein A1O3_08942 [Capronia epimyces CBS 606.96]
MSARVSTSSNTTTTTTGSVSHPSSRPVSSICVPKGKWYDCLRPTTTPYQGFGSTANFAVMSSQQNEAEVGESWTRDVYAKLK